MIQQSTFSNGGDRDFTYLTPSATSGSSAPTTTRSNEFQAEQSAQEQLYERIRKTAKISSTVLITGESGVGKSTIARMIHEQSHRKNAPFVAVNCAALPRDLVEAELFGHKRESFSGAVDERVGCFEAADGGTLFLDEVSDLPLDLQPKVLSVLQDRVLRGSDSKAFRKLDVRLVAATLQDLGELCQQGRFREDLFYRLNVLQIKVPPLRQRKSELPKFVQNLLTKIAVKQNSPIAKLEQQAMFKLQNHNWPGNIRELENVLERAAAFCNDGNIKHSDIVIDQALLSDNGDEETASDSVFYGKTLAEIEKLAIIATLEFCNGNKALTARTLGISEKSIYNKMKRLGIKY